MDRAELAAFLRAHRERLRPAEVGLPADLRPRRTAGLRREEVAELSGVGLTWYTRLEQGRAAGTTAQVIDALARALRLTPDQHRHLRVLAGFPAPPAATATDDVLPRLQRLADMTAPNLAVLYDSHFDTVAWNAPYARVRHDPGAVPPDRRNLLWMMFTDPANRALLVRWEPAARAVLSQFRAAVGRNPDDPRHQELVTALTEASPEFREWWPSYPVRDFKPATITINHPDAGHITLDVYQLRPVEYPDLLLVIQSPATPESHRRIHHLLH